MAIDNRTGYTAIVARQSHYLYLSSNTVQYSSAKAQSAQPCVSGKLYLILTGYSFQKADVNPKNAGITVSPRKIIIPGSMI